MISSGRAICFRQRRERDGINDQGDGRAEGLGAQHNDDTAALFRQAAELAISFRQRLDGRRQRPEREFKTVLATILRFGGDDRRTLDTIAHLQMDSVAFAGGAQWRGRWVMRLSVSGWATDEQDATRTADAIVAAWRAVK